MRKDMTTIFISHASEDKSSLVRPLAHALKRHGLKVWYDEFDIKAGDSLRRSIDSGLAKCTAGIVVLSPAFFAKQWPQRELDALYTAEVAGRSRIIPLWHGVNAEFIAGISPLLADRVAIPSINGVDAIATQIAKQFPSKARLSGTSLAETIERRQSVGLHQEEAFLAGCRYRFLLLNAFKEQLIEIADNAISELSEEEREEGSSTFENWLDGERERLRVLHDIPEDVYLEADEPVSESRLRPLLNAIEGWASGTLLRHESEQLLNDLDLNELDEYFVLLGVPNFSFSTEHREILRAAMIELGTYYTDGFKIVEPFCDQLRALDIDS